MTKPTKLSEIDTAKLTFTELKEEEKEENLEMFSMMEENHYLNFQKLKTFGGDEYVSEDGRKDYTMTLQITKEMESEDKEIAAAIEGLQKFEKDLENMLKVIV